MNSNDTNGFINKLSLYNDLIDGYNIKINFPKKILLEKYNLIEYFEFISSCCLFYLLSTMKNYAIEVHSLKSDCKYLGFMDLANVAYEHEMKSKENDIDFVNNNFARLSEEYTKLLNILEGYNG